MISFHILFVFVVILFLLISLYAEIYSPAMTFVIAIVALAIGGILSPQEVLHGFANEQLAIIVLLLIFSDIVRKSSVIDVLFNNIFKKATTAKGFMGRMMFYVSTSSAFFNNTPLVAMMMPYVYSWCRKHHVAPSKLFIPLSYAAILGGCATLVGTSTNLIVNGLAIEAGYESLKIFDFVYVGLPMLIIGAVYLLLFSQKLLPAHIDYVEEMEENNREYFIETHVTPNSNLIGKSIEQAKMRKLQGLFLFEIIRGSKIITPVSPEEILEENDTLLFTGVTEAITELTQPSMGLSLPQECKLPIKGLSNIVEGVISYNSGLIGKMVKETDFRGKYDGAIIAVHRNGEKLSGKIGNVVLKAGDVLLIITGEDFFKRTVNIQPFYILSKISQKPSVNVSKVALVVSGIILSVILSSLNILPLFTSLLVLLGIVLFMKIVPLTEIRKGMDFNLILLIAMGLSLGKAMINSGAAEYIAQGILALAEPLGVVGLLFGIFLITNLLAAYLTSKAAVAVIFPISVSIASSLHIDVVPFILIVAFGATANFITPIGYQTNLMVYGPGGYSFKDFFKIGLPLTIIYMIVCVCVLATTYHLW